MSLTGDILTAATSLITGLSLSPTPAIKARKRRALLDGESPPAVLIACQEQPDAERASSGSKWFVRYACGFALVQSSSGKVGDNATLRNWVDAVKGVAYDWRNWKTAGLTAVNTVEAARVVVFDDAAGEKGLDWAAVNVLIEVIETR